MAEQAREAPQTFAWFMQHALFDPAEGYYGAGRARVGREGDFLTSVRPAFSRLLLWQFAEMWEHLGRPTDFTIVEQGAHEGDFAGGILQAAETDRPDFFSSMIYLIHEPNARWRERQRRTLHFWGEKVRWCEQQLPEFVGVHFSNELLDCMPVRLVRFERGEWKELHVVWRAERFELLALPCEVPRHLPACPVDGYTTELPLHTGDWVRGVAAALQCGFVLIADYGRDRQSYYSPERTAGTLRGFSGHRRITALEQILAEPGSIDITADVEFTSLVEAAVAAGLHLLGQTDQHHFLIGVGQPEFARLEAHAAQMQTFLRSYQALIHPGIMGSAFQFLCLQKNAPFALRGFAYA